MPSVNTVKGAVDTSRLGFTLMHEHIFMHSPGLVDNWPMVWDRQGEINNAVATLTRAKATGVDTIVDLTTVDLGRNIPLLKEVASKVEVGIIVATGFWIRPPLYFYMMDIERITELFARDIEVGIAETGVKAAVIKAASDPVVDAPNEKMLKAAARAHRRTGVPISTHTAVRNKTGLTQQDVFAQEGVDLSRTIIGHSGDSEDVEYLQALVRRGSYIGMDRFGMDELLPRDRRVAVVARMCELGHANKMVISHDTCCWMDVFTKEHRAQHYPNWHILHIHNDIIPALRKAGVTQAQIDLMTRDNPRKIFERQGSY